MSTHAWKQLPRPPAHLPHQGLSLAHRPEAALPGQKYLHNQRVLFKDVYVCVPDELLFGPPLILKELLKHGLLPRHRFQLVRLSKTSGLPMCNRTGQNRAGSLDYIKQSVLGSGGFNQNGNPTQRSKKPPLLPHLASLPSLRRQWGLALAHSLPTAELERLSYFMCKKVTSTDSVKIFRFSWQQIVSRSKKHNNAMFPPFIQSLLSVWRLSVDTRRFLMMFSEGNVSQVVGPVTNNQRGTRYILIFMLMGQQSKQSSKTAGLEIGSIFTADCDLDHPRLVCTHGLIMRPACHS